MESYICSVTCRNEAERRIEQARRAVEAAELEQDVLEALEPKKPKPITPDELSKIMKEIFEPNAIKAFNRPSVLASILPKGTK